MRCPYCGGLNQERAAFCVNCGRDLRRPLPNTQPQRPTSQTPQPQSQAAYRGASAPVQPQSPPRPAGAPVQSATSASRRQPASNPRTGAPAPLQPATSPEVEPPGPFPPHTMQQFETLLSAGGQTYTVIESHEENKKKYVSIAYPRCAGWQQAATLLKALRENQEQQYLTIIIKGFFSKEQGRDNFTNGQLQFDRNVRLGSQVGNRYMVETGNGYGVDTLRFVINE